jgi:hypothetical protein
VDSSGRVIVSDYYNVVRFDPANVAGTMELFAGLPGSANGSGNGEFGTGIGGIDIDSSGNVYIADNGNSRIQVFDASGTFVEVLDNGLLQSIQDVAVDAVGDVYGLRNVYPEFALYKHIANPITDISSNVIVVGTIDDFPQPGSPDIAAALSIGPYFDGVESYVIRTEPAANRLLLLGATPLGVSHCVSRLLEELGYRQFFPGDKWEYVPSIPTLNVDINLDDRPDYLSYQGPVRMGRFRPAVRR